MAATRKFFGHRAVVDRLVNHLPPVTLLTGPPSVGKRTLARHLADAYQVPSVDRWIGPEKLTIDVARAVGAFVATAPFGPFKLVHLDLHGASDPALAAMLKTLEEPPPTARFILTSSGRLLPTITSRAHVFTMGLLRETDLRAILTQEGLNARDIERAVGLARGQVKPALAAANLSDTHRQTVLAIMRAIATGDRELYDRSFTDFDDDTRAMLWVWLREIITGQYAVFGPIDSFGLDRDPTRLRRMVLSLSAVASARSRLGVRAALEPYLAS